MAYIPFGCSGNTLYYHVQSLFQLQCFSGSRRGICGCTRLPTSAKDPVAPEAPEVPRPPDFDRGCAGLTAPMRKKEGCATRTEQEQRDQRGQTSIAHTRPSSTAETSSSGFFTQRSRQKRRHYSLPLCTFLLTLTHAVLASESPDRDCCEPLYPFFIPTPGTSNNGPDVSDFLGSNGPREDQKSGTTPLWPYEDLPEEPLFNPTVSTTTRTAVTKSRSSSSTTSTSSTTDLAIRETSSGRRTTKSKSKCLWTK